MYAFGALLARMNYINRWGLMRNAREETLAEHAAMTAGIACILAHKAKEMFGADVNPDKVTCSALFHDAGEILLGDLPTPVKYRNDEIKGAYKKLESESERRLIDTLPIELRGEISPAISGELLTKREKMIIKVADKLSALVKCIEEEQSGNHEFESAKNSTFEMITADPLPETTYFLEHFLPGYSMTLDELLR